MNEIIRIHKNPPDQLTTDLARLQNDFFMETGNLLIVHDNLDFSVVDSDDPAYRVGLARIEKQPAWGNKYYPGTTWHFLGHVFNDSSMPYERVDITDSDILSEELAFLNGLLEVMKAKKIAWFSTANRAYLQRSSLDELYMEVQRTKRQLRHRDW